ncbi:hypothetical protein KQI84_05100 [bacterium]|nr:hypothetical protein [bacterium]
MNQREKVLMIATIVAILVYVGWQFGGVSDLFDQTAPTSAEVEDLENEWNQRKSELIDAPRVTIEYRDMIGEEREDVGPNGERLRPDLRFQQEVASWARKHGFPSPNISKDIEDIRDVEEYQLVLVTLDFREASFRQVADLMKEFDQRGLIFEEVELRSSRRAGTLGGRITVARLVEAFYQTRRRRLAGWEPPA